MARSRRRSGARERLLNGEFLGNYDREHAGARLGAKPEERSHRAEWRPAPGTIFPQSKTGRAPGLAKVGANQPELILNDSNLLPFSFLRVGDRLGRAVVKIERDDGAAGTGFLIAPDILVTNHHVLPDAATASAARVHANYEAEPPGDLAGRPEVVPLDPSALFVTNPDLDCTFCGVSGLEHLGVIPLMRDSLNLLPSEYVNIIQHPSGRHKEIALQDSRVVKVDHVVVQYCCDTEPGSSGSPVFNNQWRLVAVHHASVVTEAPQGRRAQGAEPDAWYLNEGVRLSAIALWLESAEANTAELKSQTARLRATFADLDAQVGYFGALGRRAGTRSSAELVVDLHRAAAAPGTAGAGLGAVLDAAYWNLGRVEGPLLNHLADLGWIFAGMNIQLWLLAGASVEDLRVVCEHLDSCFRLDYRLLPSKDGAGVIALFRAGAVGGVEWLPGEPPEGPRRLLVRAGSGGGRQVLVPLVRGARLERIDLLDTMFRPVDLDNGDTLILLGDGLQGIDPHALGRHRGADSRIALGEAGGMVLVPGRDSRLGPMFVSPNLEMTLGDDAAVEVARDRRWPVALPRLGPDQPIALRLLLDREEQPAALLPAALTTLGRPPVGVGQRLDPELERALRALLAQYGTP